MSLIDIHIQTEDFANSIDCYDEMNVQLADNDQIDSRCGEIYISQRKILIFLCTECKENFYCYDDFFTHLCEQHMNSEDELKYEPTEESSTNEEFVDENLIVLMDEDADGEEEEDIKPNLNAEDSVAAPQDFSQELIANFETIDEYETLEEFEGNKTVTFLNDFSKFLEKDHKDMNDEHDDHADTSPMRDDKSVTNRINSDSLSNTKAATAFDTYIECKLCHKTFLGETKYRTHVKHHTKERKYKCTICGFAFTEEFNLRAHLRRHNGDKPHACQECGKRFTTRNEVKAHLRSHTGERPYICEICGQSYVTSGSLNEHKKRHTNYRPHKCQLCEKTFFDSGLLKEHVVMHTGERKHVCEVCEASFTRRKALLQHMKLHSGVKQYKCNFCNKAFAQKPGLASHLKTHRNLLTTFKKEDDMLPDDSNF